MRRIRIHLVHPRKLGTIAPEIYGHFSEHIGGVFYDGLWVGRDSDVPNIRGFRKALVEKLRAIGPPVLRWPGGCFAETYDWRDGIGPVRPVRPNWWTPCDHRYESNAVGTHEFMDLCAQVGAKAYLAANLTSCTPLHVRNWMDYCLSPAGATALAAERAENGHPEPFDVPFWGVGNENWGGGGDMTPETYAHEFRRYSVVLRNMASSVELFACGSNADDYHWTQEVMRTLAPSQRNLNGFAMHYYCGSAGDPLAFSREEWTRMLAQAQRMEEILLRNWHILCGHGMEKHARLVVDEWGCWHPDGSGPSRGYNLFEQQSTMRDAMVTALTLNIFNRHCDKVRMANVAQLVNNLHCLFLARGDGFTVTPTYHVFDLFQGHMGAEAIETIVGGDDPDSGLSVSASVKDGRTLVTIGNLSLSEDATIELEPVGSGLPRHGTATLLFADDPHAHNTFEDPEAVAPTTFAFDPSAPVTVPRAGILALSF